MFIERIRTALGELMGRRLEDVRLAVMMLDGLEIADRTHVVALGISTEGVKIPLGLWEGSTENATPARPLLADLPIATRREMSRTSCPNATVTPSGAGCALRGRSATPSSPKNACSCSPQSSTGHGPTLPARSGRAWTTRSR